MIHLCSGGWTSLRLGVCLIAGSCIVHAAKISGTISSTLVVTEDSQLTGDVTCTVTGAACLTINASRVTLDLDGYSITGNADPLTACNGSSTGGESGITATNRSGLTIRGPGVVERFRGFGIVWTNVTASTITGVTTSTNCMSGIFLSGGALNEVNGNVAIRNGNLANPCGGIWLSAGASHNRLRENRISGNGFAAQGNNFGIGLISATNTDNTIEQNEIFGNSNGLFLAAGVQGNIIRGNTIVGNPPVQVAADHSSNGGADIKNLATPGTNVFESNICVIGMNAPCPAVTPTATTRLQSQLQSLVCGTYLPAASCEVSVSVWNYYLVNLINPDLKPLILGNGTQLMTVQQYLEARATAGL